MKKSGVFFGTGVERDVHLINRHIPFIKDKRGKDYERKIFGTERKNDAE